VGVGAGLCMYDVIVKSSRSLSHLLMSSCDVWFSVVFSVRVPRGRLSWLLVIFLVHVECLSCIVLYSQVSVLKVCIKEYIGLDVSSWKYVVNF